MMKLYNVRVWDGWGESSEKLKVARNEKEALEGEIDKRFYPYGKAEEIDIIDNYKVVLVKQEV